jgi:hypothetical protein
VVKFDQPVEDPIRILSSDAIIVLPDGVLVGHNSNAKRLIQQLDLNSPKLKKWRVMWIRIVDLARKRDATLYQQLTGFPEDLPNLEQLRPPKNYRPDGIETSWYAKRQRGELPNFY